MREILFRGKDIKGIWHIGLLSHVRNAWYISNKAGVITEFEVIPETIGQYTGLTDVNGNKIFEGDIHCNKNNNKKFVVKLGHFYDEELLDDIYGWYMEDNRGELFGLNGSEYEYANIIGNIHDNPELLERSNNND